MQPNSKYPTIQSYVDHFDRDWFPQPPEVDREYIWTYPLALNTFNGSALITPHHFCELDHKMSIYVHIPFCQTSCPFCVFMHEIAPKDGLDRYVDCISKEAIWYSHHPQSRQSTIHSIYFGGGTASLLNPGHVRKMVRLFKYEYECTSNLEITLECHPDVIDERYISEIREAGVTRISIGVQSFKQNHLDTICRKQVATRTASMIAAAVSGNFNTVSVDLMYRFPEQSVDSVLDDFRQAVDMGVQSISAYSLETSDTGLEGVSSAQPNDNLDRHMFDAIRHYLASSGFDHIAQPDYALPGHRNHYLESVWSAPQALNLGIGCGAFSSNFGGYSFCNVHNPNLYMRSVEEGFLPVLLGQEIDLLEAQARYFVLGARALTVPLDPFQTLFSISPQERYGSQFLDLERLGLATIQNGYLTLSEEGEYRVDTVSKHFYTSSCAGKRVPWGSDLRHFRPQDQCAVNKLWIKEGETR